MRRLTLLYGLPHNGKGLIDVGWLRETPAVVYPASEVGSLKSRADMESASSRRHTLQAAGSAAGRVIGVARCGRAPGSP